MNDLQKLALNHVNKLIEETSKITIEACVIDKAELENNKHLFPIDQKLRDCKRWIDAVISNE